MKADRKETIAKRSEIEVEISYSAFIDCLAEMLLVHMTDKSIDKDNIEL